jgi:hypothetical protein
MVTSTPTAPNIIEGEVLYGIEELKARLRWSKHALRTARRAGLNVRYAGGRGYVLGRDAIEYISTQGKTSKA